MGLMRELSAPRRPCASCSVAGVNFAIDATSSALGRWIDLTTWTMDSSVCFFGASEHRFELAMHQQFGHRGVVGQSQDGLDQLGKIVRMRHLVARDLGLVGGHVGGDVAR